MIDIVIRVMPMMILVFWISWAAYGIVVIVFDIPGKIKGHIERNKSKQKKPERRTNPNLEKYYQAIEDNDEEAAYNALIANAKSCRCRNSYCLTEVFCPECPLEKGGIYVQSGRNGV